MWQVSGRSDITDFEEVVKLDTGYIEKPLSLRTCLIKKVCTSQAQQKKGRSVSEQSDSGDIEQ